MRTLTTQTLTCCHKGNLLKLFKIRFKVIQAIEIYQTIVNSCILRSQCDIPRFDGNRQISHD